MKQGMFHHTKYSVFVSAKKVCKDEMFKISLYSIILLFPSVLILLSLGSVLLHC